MDNCINDLYNWPRFYSALCQLGPRLLLVANDDLCEIIQMVATSTDLFWSEGLEELLAAGAADGNIRAGVLSVLELWRENVLAMIESDFGISLDWDLVWILDESPLIDELVAAALPG